MSHCPVVFSSVFFTVKRCHIKKLSNQKTAVEVSFSNKGRSIPKATPKKVLILQFELKDFILLRVQSGPVYYLGELTYPKFENIEIMI